MMADYHSHASFKEKMLADGAAVFGRVAFEYEVPGGLETRRVVDFSAKLEASTGHYFLGFCYLRQEPRVFQSVFSRNVWDVSGRRWFVDLRDWARAAPRVEAAGFAPTAEELQSLVAGRRPTQSEQIAAESAAALCDIEGLAARCLATGRWDVRLKRPTSTGELALTLTAIKPSAAKPLTVGYAPAAAIERRLAETFPPQWCVDRMPWRVTPKWPQPTRGYSSFSDVMGTLRARAVFG